MKVSITISVDNDAHDNIDDCGSELLYILARYVERMQEGSIALYVDDAHTVYNVNGNRAGQIVIDPYA